MMTLALAYERLKVKWPKGSFKVGFELWHFNHDRPDMPPAEKMEWCVYDPEERVHYYGPTLDNVMEQAVGTETVGLAEVDRQIIWAKDRSGYEIRGRL